MQENEMNDALHREMGGVHVSGSLRARTLLAMRAQAGKTDSARVKRKFSVMAAAALVGVLLCAGALAAFSRAGILDFLALFGDGEMPPNLSDYVQRHVADAENADFAVNVREALYDGREMQLIADIIPQNASVMVLPEDALLSDLWQNVAQTDDSDMRTIREVCAQGGFTSVCYASVMPMGDTYGSVGMMTVSDENGVLTCFLSARCGETALKREDSLSVVLTPAAVDADGGEKRDADAQCRMTVPFVLNASKTGSAVQDVRVSTETIAYEQVGVRIDRVLMTVSPIEIAYQIEYTVTDAQTYAATDDGLWFEFVDLQSTAAAYADQRLAEGPSRGSGADVVRMADGADGGARYCQSGTLDLRELRQTYTLRAYDCWEKQRFDTHEIKMEMLK